MQSKKSCDYNDYDHYADDAENIHCFAPIETTQLCLAPLPGFSSGPGNLNSRAFTIADVHLCPVGRLQPDLPAGLFRV